MVLFSIFPFLLALIGYVHGYITLHQKFFDKKALYSQDFVSAGLDFSFCKNTLFYLIITSSLVFPFSPDPVDERKITTPASDTTVTFIVHVASVETSLLYNPWSRFFPGLPLRPISEGTSSSEREFIRAHGVPVHDRVITDNSVHLHLPFVRPTTVLSDSPYSSPVDASSIVFPVKARICAYDPSTSGFIECSQPFQYRPNPRVCLIQQEGFPVQQFYYGERYALPPQNTLRALSLEEETLSKTLFCQDSEPRPGVFCMNPGFDPVFAVEGDDRLSKLLQNTNFINVDAQFSSPPALPRLCPVVCKGFDFADMVREGKIEWIHEGEPIESDTFTSSTLLDIAARILPSFTHPRWEEEVFRQQPTTQDSFDPTAILLSKFQFPLNTNAVVFDSRAYTKALVDPLSTVTLENPYDSSIFADDSNLFVAFGTLQCQPTKAIPGYASRGVWTGVIRTFLASSLATRYVRFEEEDEEEDISPAPLPAGTACVLNAQQQARLYGRQVLPGLNVGYFPTSFSVQPALPELGPWGMGDKMLMLPGTARLACLEGYVPVRDMNPFDDVLVCHLEAIRDDVEGIKVRTSAFLQPSDFRCVPSLPTCDSPSIMTSLFRNNLTEAPVTPSLSPYRVIYGEGEMMDTIETDTLPPFDSHRLGAFTQRQQRTNIGITSPVCRVNGEGVSYWGWSQDIQPGSLDLLQSTFTNRVGWTVSDATITQSHTKLYHCWEQLPGFVPQLTPDPRTCETSVLTQPLVLPMNMVYLPPTTDMVVEETNAFETKVMTRGNNSDVYTNIAFTAPLLDDFRLPLCGAARISPIQFGCNALNPSEACPGMNKVQHDVLVAKASRSNYENGIRIEGHRFSLTSQSCRSGFVLNPVLFRNSLATRIKDSNPPADSFLQVTCLAGSLLWTVETIVPQTLEVLSVHRMSFDSTPFCVDTRGTGRSNILQIASFQGLPQASLGMKPGEEWINPSINEWDLNAPFTATSLAEMDIDFQTTNMVSPSLVLDQATRPIGTISVESTLPSQDLVAYSFRLQLTSVWDDIRDETSTPSSERKPTLPSLLGSKHPRRADRLIPRHIGVEKDTFSPLSSPLFALSPRSFAVEPVYRANVIVQNLRGENLSPETSRAQLVAGPLGSTSRNRFDYFFHDPVLGGLENESLIQLKDITVRHGEVFCPHDSLFPVEALVDSGLEAATLLRYSYGDTVMTPRLTAHGLPVGGLLVVTPSPAATEIAQMFIGDGIRTRTGYFNTNNTLHIYPKQDWSTYGSVVGKKSERNPFTLPGSIFALRCLSDGTLGVRPQDIPRFSLRTHFPITKVGSNEEDQDGAYSRARLRGSISETGCVLPLPSIFTSSTTTIGSLHGHGIRQKVHPIESEGGVSQSSHTTIFSPMAGSFNNDQHASVAVGDVVPSYSLQCIFGAGKDFTEQQPDNSTLAPSSLPTRIREGGRVVPSALDGALGNHHMGLTCAEGGQWKYSLSVESTYVRPVALRALAYDFTSLRRVVNRAAKAELHRHRSLAQALSRVQVGDSIDFPLILWEPHVMFSASGLVSRIPVYSSLTSTSSSRLLRSFEELLRCAPGNAVVLRRDLHTHWRVRRGPSATPTHFPDSSAFLPAKTFSVAPGLGAVSLHERVFPFLPSGMTPSKAAPIEVGSEYPPDSFPLTGFRGTVIPLFSAFESEDPPDWHLSPDFRRLFSSLMVRKGSFGPSNVVPGWKIQSSLGTDATVGSTAALLRTLGNPSLQNTLCPGLQGAGWGELETGDMSAKPTSSTTPMIESQLTPFMILLEEIERVHETKDTTASSSRMASLVAIAEANTMATCSIGNGQLFSRLSHSDSTLTFSECIRGENNVVSHRTFTIGIDSIQGELTTQIAVVSSGVSPTPSCYPLHLAMPISTGLPDYTSGSNILFDSPYSPYSQRSRGRLGRDFSAPMITPHVVTSQLYHINTRFVDPLSSSTSLLSILLPQHSTPISVTGSLPTLRFVLGKVFDREKEVFTIALWHSQSAKFLSSDLLTTFSTPSSLPENIFPPFMPGLPHPHPPLLANIDMSAMNTCLMYLPYDFSFDIDSLPSQGVSLLALHTTSFSPITCDSKIGLMSARGISSTNPHAAAAGQTEPDSPDPALQFGYCDPFSAPLFLPCLPAIRSEEQAFPAGEREEGEDAKIAKGQLILSPPASGGLRSESLTSKKPISQQETSLPSISSLPCARDVVYGLAVELTARQVMLHWWAMLSTMPSVDGKTPGDLALYHPRNAHGASIIFPGLSFGVRSFVTMGEAPKTTLLRQKVNEKSISRHVIGQPGALLFRPKSTKSLRTTLTENEKVNFVTFQSTLSVEKRLKVDRAVLSGNEADVLGYAFIHRASTTSWESITNTTPMCQTGQGLDLLYHCYQKDESQVDSSSETVAEYSLLLTLGLANGAGQWGQYMLPPSLFPSRLVDTNLRLWTLLPNKMYFPPVRSASFLSSPAYSLHTTTFQSSAFPSSTLVSPILPLSPIQFFLSASPFDILDSLSFVTLPGNPYDQQLRESIIETILPNPTSPQGLPPSLPFTSPTAADPIANALGMNPGTGLGVPFSASMNWSLIQPSNQQFRFVFTLRTCPNHPYLGPDVLKAGPSDATQSLLQSFSIILSRVAVEDEMEGKEEDSNANATSLSLHPTDPGYPDCVMDITQRNFTPRKAVSPPFHTPDHITFDGILGTSPFCGTVQDLLKGEMKTIQLALTISTPNPDDPAATPLLTTKRSSFAIQNLRPARPVVGVISLLSRSGVSVNSIPAKNFASSPTTFPLPGTPISLCLDCHESENDHIIILYKSFSYYLDWHAIDPDNPGSTPLPCENREEYQSVFDSPSPGSMGGRFLCSHTEVFWEIAIQCMGTMKVAEDAIYLQKLDKTSDTLTITLPLLKEWFPSCFTGTHADDAGFAVKELEVRLRPLSSSPLSRSTGVGIRVRSAVQHGNSMSLVGVSRKVDDTTTTTALEDLPSFGSSSPGFSQSQGDLSWVGQVLGGLIAPQCGQSETSWVKAVTSIAVEDTPFTIDLETNTEDNYILSHLSFAAATQPPKVKKPSSSPSPAPPGQYHTEMENSENQFCSGEEDPGLDFSLYSLSPSFVLENKDMSLFHAMFTLPQRVNEESAISISTDGKRHTFAIPVLPVPKPATATVPLTLVRQTPLEVLIIVTAHFSLRRNPNMITSHVCGSVVIVIPPAPRPITPFSSGLAFRLSLSPTLPNYGYAYMVTSYYDETNYGHFIQLGYPPTPTPLPFPSGKCLERQAIGERGFVPVLLTPRGFRRLTEISPLAVSVGQTVASLPLNLDDVYEGASASYPPPLVYGKFEAGGVFLATSPGSSVKGHGNGFIYLDICIPTQVVIRITSPAGQSVTQRFTYAAENFLNQSYLEHTNTLPLEPIFREYCAGLQKNQETELPADSITAKRIAYVRQKISNLENILAKNENTLINDFSILPYLSLVFYTSPGISFCQALLLLLETPPVDALALEKEAVLLESAEFLSTWLTKFDQRRRSSIALARAEQTSYRDLVLPNVSAAGLNPLRQMSSFSSALRAWLATVGKPHGISLSADLSRQSETQKLSQSFYDLASSLGVNDPSFAGTAANVVTGLQVLVSSLTQDLVEVREVLEATEDGKRESVMNRKIVSHNNTISRRLTSILSSRTPPATFNTASFLAELRGVKEELDEEAREALRAVSSVASSSATLLFTGKSDRSLDSNNVNALPSLSFPDTSAFSLEFVHVPRSRETSLPEYVGFDSISSAKAQIPRLGLEGGLAYSLPGHSAVAVHSYFHSSDLVTASGALGENINLSRNNIRFSGTRDEQNDDDENPNDGNEEEKTTQFKIGGLVSLSLLDRATGLSLLPSTAAPSQDEQRDETAWYFIEIPVETLYSSSPATSTATLITLHPASACVYSEGFSTTSTSTSTSWTIDETCILHEVTPTSVICRCTHLTFFSLRISTQSLIPRFQKITMEQIRLISWENFTANFTPFMILLLWPLITFLVICVAAKIDYRLYHLAFGKLIEDWYPPTQPRLSKELVYRVSPQDSLWYILWRRYWHTIRDTHMWFSVFTRQTTHNYSSKSRAFTGMVLMLSSFTLSGLFFGYTQQGFISVTLMTSACLFFISEFMRVLFDRIDKDKIKRFLYQYAESLVYLYYTGKSSMFAVEKHRDMIQKRPIRFVTSEQNQNRGQTQGQDQDQDHNQGEFEDEQSEDRATATTAKFTDFSEAFQWKAYPETILVTPTTVVSEGPLGAANIFYVRREWKRTQYDPAILNEFALVDRKIFYYCPGLKRKYDDEDLVVDENDLSEAHNMTTKVSKQERGRFLLRTSLPHTAFSPSDVNDAFHQKPILDTVYSPWRLLGLFLVLAWIAVCYFLVIVNSVVLATRRDTTLTPSAIREWVTSAATSVILEIFITSFVLGIFKSAAFYGLKYFKQSECGKKMFCGCCSKATEEDDVKDETKTQTIEISQSTQTMKATKTTTPSKVSWKVSSDPRIEALPDIATYRHLTYLESWNDAELVEVESLFPRTSQRYSTRILIPPVVPELTLDSRRPPPHNSSKETDQTEERLEKNDGNDFFIDNGEDETASVLFEDENGQVVTMATQLIEEQDDRIQLHSPSAQED